MKDVFKGFYNLEKSDLKELWSDDKTLFVFDTNVLLNLYGYAEQTRDDFFSILHVVHENLWIPYHVGLEYQRRRLSIIRNEKVVFNDIENNLEKIQKVFKGDFEKLALKRRFPMLSESTDKLEKEISESILKYKKSVHRWDSEQPCVRSHDEIRDNLNNLFSGKVGDKPEEQKWLDELYKEGATRFKNKIPPGFKDAGKGNTDDETHFNNDGLYYERQYGDLILWKQLINRAKSEDVENVIFITDDAKEDWWYKINSNGKKIIGPLAELQSEIYRESNIKHFHMYSTSMFLEDGKSNLAVDVSESSIEDASTPHITEALNNLTSKLTKPYRSASFNDEQMREIAERASYEDNRMRELFERASFEDDRMREFAERASFEDDRMRELAERANFEDDRMRELAERASFDDDRMREIAERASFGDDQMREIIKSQNRSEKEGYEIYKTLNNFLRKK